MRLRLPQGCIQAGAWGKSLRIVKVGCSEHECGALGGFPGKAHPRVVEGFKEGSMEGLEDTIEFNTMPKLGILIV